MDAWLRDPRAVAELVRIVMRASRQLLDHACDEIGAMSFEYGDGHLESVDLLPGHDREHFEFRASGRLFQIDRTAFYESLRKGGLDPSALEDPGLLR